jgi:ribosome biogenesis protein ERB1
LFVAEGGHILGVAVEMSQLKPAKKRKAVTRDVDTATALVPGSEFENVDLSGILSDSEGDSHQSGSESEAVEDSESDTDGEAGISNEDVDGSEEDEPEDESEDEEDEEDDDIREQIRALKPNPSSEDSKLVFNGQGDNLDHDESVTKRMDDLELNYTVTKDANGNPRYVYKEIEPVYDSDDTDAQEPTNTIGNIPSSYYDAYPHIGYDINGKKIMRPARGDALDALLDSIEIPKGWTGLTDPSTGKPLELSQEELEVLKKVTRNEVVEDGYDPYPEMIEYFSSKVETMPLSAAPEPKRRFVPSKMEAKRIMQLVKAIREGRIKPYKPPSEEEEEDLDIKRYDVWADEKPEDRPDHLPAPKNPPPGYEDSYHPPPEYLPDKDEKALWEAQDPEDREKEYLPTDHDALRTVPGYDNVKMVFERCLDLYLAPRMRKSKLNIDPESLLPQLPNPDDLRPFPTSCASIFTGHQGKVCSVSVDPSGTLVASGGADGTVRIWEILTGRLLWTQKLSSEGVNVVKWRPGLDSVILTAAAGNTLFFIVPYSIHTLTPELEQASRAIIDAGFGYDASNSKSTSSATKSEPSGTWTRPLSSSLADAGILLTLTVRSPVKALTWHRRGDYLATVAPAGQSHAVAIHTLSKHLTQLPFRKLRGLPQTAAFHPLKPIFFVATQRNVRVYDLLAQKLLKSLQPGARWISSLDVHPGGDNVLVGSYDRRTLWHDLDLSARPYKTLRFHDKAVRAVRFHPGGLPLFVDASDDGTLQVFHGKVVDDLMENATIVPVRVLRGHSKKGALGVMDVDWHPRLPWCVSAGADGTVRLWT